jgi:hypothetical protein
LSTYDGQLVTVGVEGIILRSQVMPVLSSVDILSYQRQGNRNYFLFGGLPDQRFVLEYSATLTNWTPSVEFELFDSTGTLLYYETATDPPAFEFYRTELSP